MDPFRLYLVNKQKIPKTHGKLSINHILIDVSMNKVKIVSHDTRIHTHVHQNRHFVDIILFDLKINLSHRHYSND